MIGAGQKRPTAQWNLKVRASVKGKEISVQAEGEYFLSLAHIVLTLKIAPGEKE